MDSNDFTPMFLQYVEFCTNKALLEPYIHDGVFEMYIATDLYLLVTEPLMEDEELCSDEEIFGNVFSILLSAVKVAVEQAPEIIKTSDELAKSVGNLIYVKREDGKIVDINSMTPGAKDQFLETPFGKISVYQKLHTCYTHYVQTNPDFLEKIYALVDIIPSKQS